MKNTEIIQHYLDGTRPYVKTGYTNPDDKYIIRKEGEVWIDARGKEWIYKNGVKQTTTPLIDIIREESNQKCSKCGTEIRWGSKVDEKIHAKTGMCLECLVAEETQMRINGTYLLYEEMKIMSNRLAEMKQAKVYLQESINYVIEHKVFTYVNSNGLVEEWTNDARDDVLEKLKIDYDGMIKLIDDQEAELKKAKDEFDRKSATV